MLASSRRIRIFAFSNNLLLFIFSVIVVGLISHMLKAFPVRGGHIVYQEVIAAITLFIWLFGMALPLLDRYKGWLAPLNLAFSYLWLASFIFNAERLGGPKCNPNGPLRGHCSFKKAVMAFTFLTFIFMITGFIIEVLLFRSESIIARGSVSGSTSTKDQSELLGNKGSHEDGCGEKTGENGEAGRGEAGCAEGGRTEGGRTEGGRVEVGRGEAGRVEAGRGEAGRVEVSRIEIGRVEAGGRLDANRGDESGRCEEARRFEQVGRAEQSGRCQEAVRFEQVGRTEEVERVQEAVRFEQVGRTEEVRQFEVVRQVGEVEVEVQQGDKVRQFGDVRQIEVRQGEKVRRY